MSNDKTKLILANTNEQGTDALNIQRNAVFSTPHRHYAKCIVLSTGNCCYYVYSKDRSFIVTELEFAVEAYAKLRDKTNYTKKTIGSTGT